MSLVPSGDGSVRKTSKYTMVSAAPMPINDCARSDPGKQKERMKPAQSRIRPTNRHKIISAKAA